MSRARPHHEPDTRSDGLHEGRIILLVLNAFGLVAILFWSIVLQDDVESQLPLRLAYLFSVAFLFLVRPLLGVGRRVRTAWVIADSVVILLINGAVLLLVSRSGLAGVSATPAFVVLVASAVLGATGALLARNGLFSGRTYLTATLLMMVVPAAAWLGFAEVARARIDWLLALSPIGAAAVSVMPVAASGVAQAGAAWLTLLAVLSLAWAVRPPKRSGGPSAPLSVLILIGCLALSADAQQTQPAAKLEVGLNGVIIAGAWNPARLSIENMADPMLVVLNVDGRIRHHVNVAPGRGTEFLVFIPAEQPVFSLRPVACDELVAPSSIALPRLSTISAEHWPGMVVTGPRPQNSDLTHLTERAPGCKFLEVELTRLKKLPSAYLAQFPVVMLQTADVQGLPRDQFVRLTEWVASRTLVIGPGSGVRADWPGLHELAFKRLHGYDVLNPKLLDILPHPRTSLIDPDIYFFGSSADWRHHLQRTVLLASCTLLVVGTAFYLLIQMRVNRPALVGAATMLVLAGLLLAGLSAVSAQKSKPVITTLILQEGVPGSPVILETRLRQISAAQHRMYEVTDDTPVGWVPVYAGESQRRANVFSVSGFADGAAPDVRVFLVQGPQIFVGVSTRLSAASLRDDGLLLQVLGGEWTALRSREGDAELSNVPVEGASRYLKRRTEGILDERFLNWWSRRRVAAGRWLMHVSVEADQSVGGRTVRVFALCLPEPGHVRTVRK